MYNACLTIEKFTRNTYKSNMKETEWLSNRSGEAEWLLTSITVTGNMFCNIIKTLNLRIWENAPTFASPQTHTKVLNFSCIKAKLSNRYMITLISGQRSLAKTSNATKNRNVPHIKTTHCSVSDPNRRVCCYCCVHCSCHLQLRPQTHPRLYRIEFMHKPCRDSLKSLNSVLSS